MKKVLSPTDKKLHDQFSEYGLRAKEWTRKCIVLLPEIEKREIWKQKGFSCIYEYAAKLAGMSRNTVDDALRILKKIEDKPCLRKIAEAKGINAVRPIAAIATRETEQFWAEKAMAMSKNTLETYVKDFRTSTAKNAENPHQQAIENFNVPAGNFPAQCFGHTDAISITMELDPEIADQLQKLKGNGDWNQLMKEFLELRNQKLRQEKPKAVKTESRHIPAKIKRHVVSRTNGTCSFPCCKKPYEILHHTKRLALNKAHDPDHIEPLCKAHERLAHLGLIAKENLPAPNWQLRQNPDKNDVAYCIDALVTKFRKGPRDFSRGP